MHSDITLKTVQNTPNESWLNYTERVYNGTDNGIYWFKIDLTGASEDAVISIPESHVARAVLYNSNKEISKLAPSRYVIFNVKPNLKDPIFYLKVDCHLDATIPIKIENTQDYLRSETNDYLQMGLYYGIVISILLFNLFSYFSFKNRTYLHYMFMVLGMSINAFYKDGLSAQLLGLNGINEVIEPTFSSIICFSAIFFTASYLNLNQHLPKFKYIGIGAMGIAVLFNISYLISGDFILFAITDIFNLLVLDIYWSASLLLWKKSPEARFFALAYGLPLLLAHDYFISPHFGINGLGLPFGLYKIGSIFEMVIFTYAIMYQAKKLALENKSMKREIRNFTTKLKEANKGVNDTEATVNSLIEIYRFTIKEIEVLKAVAKGMTNREIGESLFVSNNTVKYHIKNIFNKLNVKTRKEAGKKFLNLNVEEPSEDL